MTNRKLDVNGHKALPYPPTLLAAIEDMDACLDVAFKALDRAGEARHKLGEELARWRTRVEGEMAVNITRPLPSVDIPLPPPPGGSGVASKRARLDEESISGIKKMILAGKTTRQIAEECGVTVKTVSNIRYGQTGRKVEPLLPRQLPVGSGGGAE